MFEFGWLDRSRYFNSYENSPGNIASNMIIAFFVTDIVLGTLIYISGGLKENRWLLHIYYFYSVGGSVLTVLLASANLGLSVGGCFTSDKSSLNFIIEALTHLGCFVTIALQLYFVFLLRKEIISHKMALLKQKSIKCPMQWNDDEGQKEKGYSYKCEK